MKDNSGKPVRLPVFMVLAVVILSLFIVRDRNHELPLACLAMTSPDSSFTIGIVKELEPRLKACGNQVLISYCENDFSSQINQIENFIAMQPELLIIDCMEDGGRYDDVLKRIQDTDIQVVVLNSAGDMEYADIQMVSSRLGRGICASVLIRKFLDQSGKGENEPAKVLLLGNSSTEKEIMTMAGYQLMGERFLRRYDMNSLSFVKEDAGTVFYTDGYGIRRKVDEPTGGLILNEDGDAILNLYYEPGIELITADNYMNVQTNLQGQKAMDAFLGDPKNRDVRIVVAVSGEAAVGAATRLEECLSEGILQYDQEKIAVFGTNDTEQNRFLVASSAGGQGVFRGFVGDFNIAREADKIVRNLLTKNKGVYRCYSFYSGCSGSEIGIVVLYDTGISEMDFFGKDGRT